MAVNLVDHIGNQVTVWTKVGNALENRTLITADEMGVVVSGYQNDRVVFMPWCQVNYVDLITPVEAKMEKTEEITANLVEQLIHKPLIQAYKIAPENAYFLIKPIMSNKIVLVVDEEGLNL